MKHPFSSTCDCARCLNERARRERDRDTFLQKHPAILAAREQKQTRTARRRAKALDTWARRVYDTDSDFDCETFGDE